MQHRRRLNIFCAMKKARAQEAAAKETAKAA